MKAGEEFNIKPTGPSDIRRIEGAIFNWGADMTYDNNPIEMGLDRLVDWDTLSDDACISLAALKEIRPRESRRIAVEVNGLTPRLDLKGEHVRDAIAAGVRITCSTDSHSAPGLENVRYAVWTARRGGATPADVLNTRPLAEMLAPRS